MDYSELIQIIADVTKIPIEEISEDTNLFLDLGMDSLEFFKMVTSIDEALGIGVGFITMDKASTVSDLQSLIASRGAHFENREIYHG